MPPPIKRHFRVDRYHRVRPYKSPRQFHGRKVPLYPNGQSHARNLLAAVAKVQTSYTTLSQSWEGNEDVRARGIIVELESVPGVEPHATQLEAEGWELLNERRINVSPPIIRQTWFVPDGKLGILSRLLNDYLTKTRNQKGGPQPAYRPFVESIERVGPASVKQLWTELDDFPFDETRWFEVWLRAGKTAETGRQF